MSTNHVIHTEHAPAAIGSYSQAVRRGNWVFLSGQIGLDPATMGLVDGIEAQIHQCFNNLRAVAVASSGSLADVVRVSIYLTDLSHFDAVNKIMSEYFLPPYPARVTIGVASLPKGALVEVDGILALPQ